MIHAAESATNVVIGYGLNLILVYLLLHELGYQIRLHENAWLSLVLAVVAFARGYAIRKLFHKLKS